MRVIAVRDADEHTVNIYGFGEYVGDEPCPSFFDIPNPKILLDNGGVVWGYQCWWCDAEKFQSEMLCGRDIVTVPQPDTGRKE